MRNPKFQNPILEKSFNFSLSVISFTEKLEVIRRYNVSNQLFRSGTSIGANIREAQSAESPADFIHKMKIAAKEAEETEYWLLLCKFSENYPFEDSMIEKLESIQKLLSAIISTSKKRYPKH